MLGIRVPLLVFSVTLLLPASLCIAIHEEILFQSESEAHIHLVLENLTFDPLVLSWPLSPLDLLGEPDASEEVGNVSVMPGQILQLLVEPLGNRTRGELSFKVRLSCREGETQSFPVPRCNVSLPIGTLKVFLPQGWTAIWCSSGCEKRYDANTGRIVLWWQEVTSDGCLATPSIPGSGNPSIRGRMRWVLIRGYLLSGTILASLLFSIALLYRLLRSSHKS